MQKIFSHKTVSITELQNPSQVIIDAGNSPVAIIDSNKIVAYLVPNTVVENNGVENSEKTIQELSSASKADNQAVLDYLKDK